jgi:hypothetical protein
MRRADLRVRRAQLAQHQPQLCVRRRGRVLSRGHRTARLGGLVAQRLHLLARGG